MMNSDMIQGIIFFAYIITTFTTAFGFAHIAGEKGYSKIGYWFWCFLFGIAGWIMVAALPDRRKNRTKRRNEDIQPDEPTITDKPTVAPPSKEMLYICKECKTWFPEPHIICPHCKSEGSVWYKDYAFE